MNQENLQKLIDLLAKVKIGFVAINEYTATHNGEKSARRINIGFSYEKLKKDDLKTLQEGVAFIPSDKYGKGDWDVAIAELKQSLIAPNENRSKAQEEAYMTLTENGAIRYNYTTQQLYIMGLELDGSKKVLEKGTKKVVKSAPKTIAKNVIKSEYLKQGLIRNFVVHQIHEVKASGEILEITQSSRG